MSTYATQSVALDAVLDGLQSLLERATGLASRNVIEWHGQDRPSVDTPGTVVWWRWVDEAIDADSGAGRHGMGDDLTAEVNVTTRAFKDGGMRDKRLARVHIATRYLIVNAVAGRVLHSAYDARIGDEPPMPTTGADVLSARGTMKIVKLPAYDRPRPEQGYVETRVGVLIPCVLKVTLNDVSASEG